MISSSVNNASRALPKCSWAFRASDVSRQAEPEIKSVGGCYLPLSTAEDSVVPSTYEDGTTLLLHEL